MNGSDGQGRLMGQTLAHGYSVPAGRAAPSDWKPCD